MRTHLIVGVMGLVCALAPACTAPDAFDSSARTIVGSPLPAGQSPRGVYVMTDPAPFDAEAQPVALSAGAPTVFFLNRKGGVYTPGRNDSSTNRSSIPSQTSQVP